MKLLNFKNSNLSRYYTYYSQCYDIVILCNLTNILSLIVNMSNNKICQLFQGYNFKFIYRYIIVL